MNENVVMKMAFKIFLLSILSSCANVFAMDFNRLRTDFNAAKACMNGSGTDEEKVAACDRALKIACTLQGVCKKYMPHVFRDFEFNGVNTTSAGSPGQLQRIFEGFVRELSNYCSPRVVASMSAEESSSEREQRLERQLDIVRQHLDMQVNLNRRLLPYKEVVDRLSNER